MRYEVLRNEEGRVLTGRHVALYRDGQGQLHAITSICTHRVATSVGMTRTRSGTAPVGSRFTATGEVIRGPATRPLVVVDIPN